MPYVNPSWYAKVGAFGVARMAGANMARAFAIVAENALLGSVEGLQETVQQLAEGGNRATKIMENEYPAIARKSQQAVLAALDEALGPAGRYREGEGRISGGKLRKAIEEASFISTAHGVRMLNKSRMNNTAKHWYRMNFGAAPVGKGVDSAWALKVGGVVVGELSMRGRSDNEMLMPQAGFFSKDGKSQRRSVARRGQDRLMVKPKHTNTTRKHPMIRTQGMAAMDFFSPGARTMAREMGRSISLAMDEVTGKTIKTRVRTVKVVV